MIYKLIILTASLLFIWEFMKVRSTAVAQVEPTIQDKFKAFTDANKNKTILFQEKFGDCKDLVIGVTGEPVCVDDMPAWIKLNGA
jgi:hypothetical protein